MVGEAELIASYRRHERALYNVLYRWLWHAQDCEDVMHEAYLKLWGRRDRIDAATLDALVYTTALNLARNRLRWRTLWRFGELEPDTAAPDDPAVDTARAETQARVRSALETLSAKTRNVVLLSEFAGLATAEIAAVLGIPAGTVGSRKHAGIGQLRRVLEDDADG